MLALVWGAGGRAETGALRNAIHNGRAFVRSAPVFD
jgi:hypothetical protein